MNKMAAGAPMPAAQQKPLVALLDGRDCTVEMPLLKDIATVAFCDAQLTTEIHEKVLNEAVAALLYSIRLSREDLLKFRSLKLIVKIGNPDVHNLDVAAATQLGIAICNTPAEGVEEAADHTIALILNMYRRTFWVAKAVQMGKKVNNAEQLREMMAGARRVRGSTLGIVGFGRVGCAVALRAKALGFRVIFHDPYSTRGMERAFCVEQAEKLTDLLSQSDCVSFHCQLSQETRHLLNSETLKRLKYGAFIVNTSEAELVDLKALIGALKSGQVKAAALDIQQRAPDEAQAAEYEALISLPNVICTPNCAWFSEESIKEMRASAAKEVRRALSGQMPENLQNCVNKSDLLALRLAKKSAPIVVANGAGNNGPLMAMNGTADGANSLGHLHFGTSNEQHFLPKSGAHPSLMAQIISQQRQQQEVQTTSFAPASEYSAIPLMPAISMMDGAAGVNPAAADSLAFLAYQNFLLRNPHLLMTAAGAMSAPPGPVSSTMALHDFGTPSNFVAHFSRPPSAAKSPCGAATSQRILANQSMKQESKKAQQNAGENEEKEGEGREGTTRDGDEEEEEQNGEGSRNDAVAAPTAAGGGGGGADDHPFECNSPQGRLFIADDREGEMEEGEEDGQQINS